jgi:hypothetical protein
MDRTTDIIEKLTRLPDERRAYLVSTLVTHLSDSSQYQRIRILFDSDAWLHIRYENSGFIYNDYLSDLLFAWENHLLSTSGQNVEMMIDNLHFAIIATSINSIQFNYTPQIIIRALELEFPSWTSERAISIDLNHHPDCIDLYLYLFESCPLTREQESIVSERSLSFVKGSAHINKAAKLFHAVPNHMKGDILDQLIASYKSTPQTLLAFLVLLSQKKIINEMHRQKVVRELLSFERKDSGIKSNMQQRYDLVCALVNQISPEQLKNPISWEYPIQQIGAHAYDLVLNLLKNIDVCHHDSILTAVKHCVTRHIQNNQPFSIVKFAKKYNFEINDSRKSEILQYLVLYWIKLQPNAHKKLSALEVVLKHNIDRNSAKIALDILLELILIPSNDTFIRSIVSALAEKELIPCDKLSNITKDIWEQKSSSSGLLQLQALLLLNKLAKFLDIELLKLITNSYSTHSDWHIRFNTLSLHRFVPVQKRIYLKPFSCNAQRYRKPKPTLVFLRLMRLALGGNKSDDKLINSKIEICEQGIGSYYYALSTSSDIDIVLSYVETIILICSPNGEYLDLIDDLLYLSAPHIDMETLTKFVQVLLKYMVRQITYENYHIDTTKIINILSKLDIACLNVMMYEIKNRSSAYYRAELICCLLEFELTKQSYEFAQHKLEQEIYKIPHDLLGEDLIVRIYQHLASEQQLDVTKFILERLQPDENNTIIWRNLGLILDDEALAYTLNYLTSIRDSNSYYKLVDHFSAFPTYRIRLEFKRMSNRMRLVVSKASTNFTKFYSGLGIVYLLVLITVMGLGLHTVTPPKKRTSQSWSFPIYL